MAVATTSSGAKTRPLVQVKSFGAQVALIGSALGLYLATRRFTVGEASEAAKNARDLLDFEQIVGIDVEVAIQDVALDWPSLITLMNWVYVWGHWPVLAATTIWLFFRHPPTFLVYRNSLILSGLIGLAIFAFYPVMPPRLLGIGMIDTVDLWSTSYHIFQPPSLVNQYAAVPSFHVGWNLLVAMSVFQATRKSELRLLAALGPPMMVTSVIVTANHFVLDVVAGVTVVVVAWIVSDRLQEALPKLLPGHSPSQLVSKPAS